MFLGSVAALWRMISATGLAANRRTAAPDLAVVFRVDRHPTTSRSNTPWALRRIIGIHGGCATTA